MDYENLYRGLYEFQREGAEEDYEEYFAAKFNPDHFNWKDEHEAKSALLSLLDELYEDMEECYYNKLLDEFGIDETALR